MVNQIFGTSDLGDLLDLGTPEGRRILFQNRLGQSSLTTPFNRPFLSNMLPNVENQFFGNLGSRIQEGQDPITFQEFLNNGFNLDRQIRRAPVSQTGRGQSRLTSPARFLFNA